MPRSNISFNRYISKKKSQHLPKDAKYILIKKNEKILKQQIDDNMQIDRELNESATKSIESGKSTTTRTIINPSLFIKEFEENDGSGKIRTDDDIDSKNFFLFL